MKKIFTLLFMSVMVLAANAQVTIHVKADAAPYLWAWNDSGDLMPEAWPGHQMTEKKTVQGTEFWTYTFDATVALPVNILFNNGEGKQTGNITGITTDRYFTYDGENSFEDVSDQYGVEIPDAVVDKLGLAGNHNSWGVDAFDVVEPGKVFRISVDLTSVTVQEDLWRFKIRPNNQDWVGFMGVTFDGAAPAWCYEAPADGNFEIDLEIAGRIFTFTATWGGGKHADENWTFKAEQGAANIDAIQNVSDSAAPRYNVAGQSVTSDYRGVVIQNGRKVVSK